MLVYRKKPNQKERALRIFCVQFVHACCPGVTVVGSMNDVWLGDGKNKFAYIETLKNLGCLVENEPDLMLRWPPGKTLYVELKIKGESPRSGQEKRLLELNANGFPAEWVDSQDDFIAILKLHNVPMRHFS